MVSILAVKQQNDSLAYKTKSGRTVYGGGGIMPDVFVGRDTTNFTNFFYNLRASGVLYQFALQYADEHRASGDQPEGVWRRGRDL